MKNVIALKIIITICAIMAYIAVIIFNNNGTDQTAEAQFGLCLCCLLLTKIGLHMDCGAKNLS